MDGTKIFQANWTCKAYSTNNGYWVDPAYEWQVNVFLQDQYKRNGKYYSKIGLEYCVRGKSGFYWTGNNTWKLYTRNSATSQAWADKDLRITGTRTIPASYTWYTIGTWEGEMQHDVRGNVAVLDFWLSAEGTGAASNTTNGNVRYFTDKNTYISAGYVPDIEVNVKVPLKIGDSMVDSVPYILIGGEWKEAKPYILVNGAFKEGISS